MCHVGLNVEFLLDSPHTVDDSIDEACYLLIAIAGKRDRTTATLSREDGGPNAPGGLCIPAAGKSHMITGAWGFDMSECCGGERVQGLQCVVFVWFLRLFVRNMFGLRHL